jgi:hypothetical protein
MGWQRTTGDVPFSFSLQRNPSSHVILSLINYERMERLEKEKDLLCRDEILPGAFAIVHKVRSSHPNSIADRREDGRSRVVDKTTHRLPHMFANCPWGRLLSSATLPPYFRHAFCWAIDLCWGCS